MHQRLALLHGGPVPDEVHRLQVRARLVVHLHPHARPALQLLDGHTGLADDAAHLVGCAHQGEGHLPVQPGCGGALQALRVLALAVRPLLAIKLALPGLGPKLGCELRGLRGSSGKVLLLRGYIHGLLLLRGLLLRGIISTGRGLLLLLRRLLLLLRGLLLLLGWLLLLLGGLLLLRRLLLLGLLLLGGLLFLRGLLLLGLLLLRLLLLGLFC
mmetsp:Transcript_21786/g.60371  ORF Transcript_21786/g.60371 Transcript_21786/m.60371 type:complete len:213 (+) Transcript_21786:1277-1915(+)